MGAEPARKGSRTKDRIIVALVVAVCAVCFIAGLRATAGWCTGLTPIFFQLGALRVDRVIVPEYETNCYILWDAVSKEALVIDPGGDPHRIHDLVEARGLSVTGVLETHGHYDHVEGSATIQRLTGAPIFRHGARGGAPDGLTVRPLAHGDRLRVGSLELEVLHTPGHEPSSVCLFGERVLFSGDLLFQGSVGRTDVDGGDETQLFSSILSVLAEVPDETVVLPGHGERTTMGEERRTNPFILERAPRQLSRARARRGGGGA